MPRTSASESSKPVRGREFVQGLQRGFAVIKAFSSKAPDLTIADVAERAQLTRAVARRYLLTLEELGYVTHVGTRFSLTPRILELGFTYLSTMNVANVGEPSMERVVERLHESCSMSVLDGFDIVYIARVPAKRIMSINLVTGSRLRAHATSMGKVLLAALSPKELDEYLATAPLERFTQKTLHQPAAIRKALAEIRRNGWAFADEESEQGVRTVAAPIVDRSCNVLAAINVSGHAARVSMKELKRTYLPVLLEAARTISLAMGAPAYRVKSWDGPIDWKSSSGE